MKIQCVYSELVSVDSLKPHPRNRNIHPQDQIERLSKILAYQGIRAPIVVSKISGYIVKGHGTLMAIKANGATHAPVVYQDFDDETQEYAFVQSDNAVASWAELDLSGINTDLADLGPDSDIDLLGIKGFEIEVADKALGDEEALPEAPVEPKTKLGDIYKLGNNRLMCGDSTSIDAVEKLMVGEKAELCFTSPPYSDQREYNGGKELATEHLAKFISTAFGSCNYFAVNLGYSRKDGEVYQYWNDYIAESAACGLKLLSWNVWDRSGMAYTMGQATAMFTIDHEWVFVFGTKAKELNRTIENKHAGNKNHGTNRQKDGSLTAVSNQVTHRYRQLGTVLRHDVERDRDNPHPAKFPVGFAEQYVEAMTDSGDSVYEPFGGSGSTLIACEKTGRKCFMMELDPKYVDVIVARFEAYSGQKAELLTPHDLQTV